MLPPCSHVFNHPAPAGVATGDRMSIFGMNIFDFERNRAKRPNGSRRGSGLNPDVDLRWDRWVAALFATAFVTVSIPAIAQTILDGSGTDMTDKVRRSMIEQITSELKDPVSAQFRHIRSCTPTMGTAVVWAGEVNAKNSYGGYGGFKKFFFALGSDGKATGAILDADQLFNETSEFLYKSYGCSE